jgi:glycosyltransferase involved in cell wall biosynthesis
MQKRYADKSEPEVSESEVITTQMGMGPNSYEAWLVSRPAEYWSTQSELNCTPLVSILMPVFDLSPELLDQAITSVLNQVYSEWELCIVDDCSKNRQTVKYLRALHDPRIKVHFSEKNENISLASNHAADLATGEYITLLDHDDMLAPNALLELVLEAQKGADFVYSDEDFLVSDGELEHPHFKPEYSPDLLLSHNYITHMVLIESELFNKVGRFREGYDGAQDYDLYLRLVEQAKKIAHVAKPLYHWRMIESSTSMNPEVKPEAHENARQALKDALVRRGEPAAEVLDGNKMHYFRVRRPIQDDPLVSIVIPLKDKPWLLTKCIQAIQLHSSYQHYEIICVSNDSTSPILFEALENYSKHDLRIRTVELNQGFNFSCVVNAGVRQAKGKHVLLLNNDIEVLSSDWIESLLEHSQRDDVAVVGGKLYYPDRTIQHAGVVLGLGGYAGHIHKNFPAHDDGYANRLQVVQNVTAVTGALLMVKRSIYLELGGFDEEAFAVAFNDVDFCVRAREAGYLNIFTPYCEAYHFESKSRGYEVTPDKASRFSGEMANFRDRHLESIEQGDPYHNPNFDKGHDDYRYLK